MTVVLNGRDRSNARMLQWLILAMEYSQKLSRDVLEVQLGLQKWELDVLESVHVKNLKCKRRRTWSEAGTMDESPSKKIFCHEI